MIKCLLIDDEPYALELLAKYIAEFADMEVAAQCRSVDAALPVLQSEHIDLLFLDVKMPKMTGMEFLKEMGHIPDVILTTAYREYAVQAFEFGVLDYLLKPISFLRFSKAVQRYRQQQADKATGDIHHIVVKSGFQYHKIELSDIQYIQSAKEYVSIISNKEKYMVRGSMGEILSQLPDNSFIQVHKSYIVPLSHIRSISTAEVYLAGNVTLPLGRSFARSVKAAFSASAK